MKLGLAMGMQNWGDWARFLAAERHENVPGRPAVSDHQIFNEDVALGLQAEPLGFDSIFVPEHHFTPYNLCTSPLQLMTYVAAKTERVDLGSMVVVLPWHQPIRVAEQAIMLQNLMGPSRQLHLGLGRGAARREFAGFGIDMAESRQRFKESVDILKLAFTQDRFSYEGQHFKVAETEMRPSPINDRQLDYLYGVWGSAESAPIIAEQGLKPFIIPQKSSEAFDLELRTFAEIRAANGYRPEPPLFSAWMYCAATEEEAREGALKYLPEYAQTPFLHYELGGAHFANVKGYENYANGGRASGTTIEDLTKDHGQTFIDNSVWGTPEQCFEKIKAIHAQWGVKHLILMARYGSMTIPTAQKSLDLFAKEVLPEARKLGRQATPEQIFA